ncbi:hypothetical protein D3C77_485410 [compost metagenome]
MGAAAVTRLPELDVHRSGPDLIRPSALMGQALMHRDLPQNGAGHLVAHQVALHQLLYPCQISRVLLVTDLADGGAGQTELVGHHGQRAGRHLGLQNLKPRVHAFPPQPGTDRAAAGFDPSSHCHGRLVHDGQCL